MPIYMKYGDIKGDVTAAGHVDWIELTSVQFGTTPRAAGGTGGGGNRPAGHTVEEIFATKSRDKATQPLMREVAGGTATDVTIDFVASDGHVSMTVTLGGTLISSWSLSGSGSNPTEFLTLNFTKIEFVKK